MIYGIEPGSESFKWQGKGMVYTVGWKCDWTDIAPVYNSELPKFGDKHPYNSNYYVVDIDVPEGFTNVCICKVTYSTDRSLAESWCDEDIDISLESAEDAKGYTYKNAGTPVTENLQKQRPKLVLTLTMRETAPSLETFWPIMNSVNDRKFRGIPVGCLKFVGAKPQNRYAGDGSFISASTAYTFEARAKEWKYDWRNALQARESNGNFIFWNNDPNLPFYTTDPTKIGTEVWLNQVPGQESNIAGISDWDIIEKDSKEYYEECDFHAVLGLPRKEGDDE